MARRGAQTVNNGQLDLFGGGTLAPDAPAARPVVASGFGGKADVVAELLGDIRDGQYGRLDGSDRVVRIEDGERCRYAPDAEAEAVESLLRQRYAALAPVTQMRHGVIAKDVYPFKLTPGGRGLLQRWSQLRVRRTQ